MSKKIIFLYFVVTASVLLLHTSCRESEQLIFNSASRIHWKDTATVHQTFINKKSNVTRDTVWIPLQVIGEISTEPRQINIKQIKGYFYSYTYDKKGNITDTILTEAPSQAIPNVHYVAFDSEEMKKNLLLKSFITSNKSGVEINLPLILLRDKSLKEKDYLLFLQLEPSSDFLLGDKQNMVKIISISDRLAKPSGWGVFEDAYLGKYSYARHKFMNEALGTVIDNAWLNQSVPFLIFYREKCRSALEVFNANPENIATGIAPLREDSSNPNSPLITFPTSL